MALPKPPGDGQPLLQVTTMSLQQGFVYLVKIGKVYKIGFTKKSVKEKVSELQKVYSEKVKVIASFPTTDGTKNENYFNEKLKAYQVTNGFLNLPKQLVDSCKDWFKSIVNEPETTSGKGFQSNPKSKEVKPVRLLPPLPPFPEFDSFNELIANGSDNFAEEFDRRYSAMMEASKNLSPEELEYHHDEWARANMTQAEYSKYLKEMEDFKRRFANKRNRN